MRLRELLWISPCIGMNAPEYPEDYTGLIENPAYTFLLTIEDACRYSDDPRCIDCGSCVYFRQPRLPAGGMPQ